MKQGSKKLWLLVGMLALVLMVTVGMPGAAMAEGASVATDAGGGVDLTGIMVSVIGTAATVLSALLTWAARRYVIPWLEQKGLTDAAVIVVNAVEAIIGQYCEGDKSLFSESKWRLALEKMRERGYNMDSEAVKDALKAAWQKLDIAQIAAGVKEPEVYVPPDAGDEAE